MVSRLNPAAHPAKIYSSQPRFSGKTEEDNQAKQTQSHASSSNAEGISSAEAPADSPQVKSESSTQDTKPQEPVGKQEKKPGILQRIADYIKRKLAEWHDAIQTILNTVLEHLREAAEKAKQQTQKGDSTATSSKAKASASSSKAESSTKKASTETNQAESNPIVEDPDDEAEPASPKAASAQATSEGFSRTSSAQSLNSEGAEDITLDHLMSIGAQLMQSLLQNMTEQNGSSQSSQTSAQAPIQEEELSPPGFVTIEELDEHDNPIPGTKVVHPTGGQSPKTNSKPETNPKKDKKAS